MGEGACHVTTDTAIVNLACSDVTVTDILCIGVGRVGAISRDREQ